MRPTAADAAAVAALRAPSGSAHMLGGLAPSWMYEPAVVLSGVGSEAGQADGLAGSGDGGGHPDADTESVSDGEVVVPSRLSLATSAAAAAPAGEVVFHAAYAWCGPARRWVMAWTDRRGELLDVATAAAEHEDADGDDDDDGDGSGGGGDGGACRRRVLGRLWARGRRWWLPHVAATRVVVTKVGALGPAEAADWAAAAGQGRRAAAAATSTSCGGGGVSTPLMGDMLWLHKRSARGHGELVRRWVQGARRRAGVRTAAAAVSGGHVHPCCCTTLAQTLPLHIPSYLRAPFAPSRVRG